MSGEAWVFRGEERLAGVPADDRGLAYGDALFETLRAHHGTLPWWPRHWARLRAGAERLAMPLPDEALVHAHALQLLAGRDAVLKLQLTRGSGGRGYAPPSDAVPLWLLSLHPVPAPTGPLQLIWCETRLARQPLLAGIKHANRLEQVLARAEVVAAGVDDGVVCDVAGPVTCGTASNVFILQDDAWHTPELDHAGVAGICRGWVMEQVPVRVRRIRQDEVLAAQAVILTNAVRGILPVARIAAQPYAPHPAVLALRQRLAIAHPAFASDPS